VRIGRVGPPETAHYVTLVSVLVAGIKRHAIGNVLDRVAVEIDLEFVHPLRVVTGRGNWPSYRVADIDDEDRAHLAPEQIKVRDVEANVLTGERRIKVMGHVDLSP
jgi:hypothetical protein